MTSSGGAPSAGGPLAAGDVSAKQGPCYTTDPRRCADRSGRESASLATSEDRRSATSNGDSRAGAQEREQRQGHLNEEPVPGRTDDPRQVIRGDAIGRGVN